MEAFRGFVAEAEALKVEAEALLLKKMLIPAQNKVQEAKSKRLRAELLLSAGYVEAVHDLEPEANALEAEAKALEDESTALASGGMLTLAQSKSQKAKSKRFDAEFLLLSGQSKHMQRVRDAENEESKELDEQNAESEGVTEASSGDALASMSETDLAGIQTKMAKPIAVLSGQPVCNDFDSSCYSLEDAATPAFMEHHKQQLAKFGIEFGPGGFQAYDLHAEPDLYVIKTKSGELFSGTVSGSIAPYGILPYYAGRNSVVLYLHKQSDAQKQAYCDKQPDMAKRPDSDSSGHLKYETHQPETIFTLMGAYAHNEHPAIMDLTDGVTHHLLQIRGDNLFVWENQSPQQAYYKQAEVIKSLASLLSEKKLRFTLEDIPEELQRPVKKARSLCC